MKKFFGLFVISFFFLLTPLLALAEFVAPETIEQANQMGLIPALIQAALVGKWAVAIGALIMILVVILRQYFIPKWKISEAALPYVAIALALISGIGAQMFGGLTVDQAATVILASGGIASQMWSLFGKAVSSWLLKLLGKKLAKSPKPLNV